MNPALLENGLLGISAEALHRSRQTFMHSLGDGAAACLQEIGTAAGGRIYAAFCRWLPEYSGVSDPGELDAARFGEILSAFFRELGWGALEIERLGSAGLSITSGDWAEAQPGADVPYPSCFLSSGLFADFLSRLASGPIAIMEVECRSRDDSQCRFFAASPETLNAVYAAVSAGRDYREVIGG